MKLHFEFYGPISDRMGGAGFSLETDAAPQNRAALIAWLSHEHEGAGALGDSHIQIAINDELVRTEAGFDLSDGDRIAFLSPFSGG
ncbi:MoaD/ThiS family protein [Hyphobacterium sp. HN65]|uniref:MoaD/ThiS family protein n=1 Tax=Hyphobacterium lacteum TaxID=3116575 RepID=A0ABU7LP82_9PROT|nr:MoaD/ThiS family protein [Hyphobacterium sp. HN65]MEE2525728.1 MoaD/ThiS family protein [Hyphobacterium sp. HN65]